VHKKAHADQSKPQGGGAGALFRLFMHNPAIEVSADILNHFWIQVAVPRNRFGNEAVKNLYCAGCMLCMCNGHSPTDAGFRSGVTVM
jgi:hypothetical protein